MASLLTELNQTTTLPTEATYLLPPSYHIKSKEQVELKPTMGDSFSGSNAFVEFKIPNRGYIDPRSVYMEFTLDVVGTELEDVRLYSAHDLFQRVRCYAGNANFSDRTGYNRLHRKIEDFTLSDEARGSQKQILDGVSTWPVSRAGTGLGSQGFDNSVLTTSAAATTAKRHYCIRPDVGILTSQVNVPAKWFGQPISLRMYLEDAAEAFHEFTIGAGASTITSYTISDVTLVYEELNFGPGFDERMMNRLTQGGDIPVYYNEWAQTEFSISAKTEESIIRQPYSSQKAFLAMYRLNSEDGVLTQDHIGQTKQAGLENYTITVGTKRGVPIEMTSVAGQIDISKPYRELNKAFGGVSTGSVNALSYSFDDTTVRQPSPYSANKFMIGHDFEASGSVLSGSTHGTEGSEVRLNQKFDQAPGAHSLDVYTNYDAVYLISRNGVSVLI